MAYSVSLDELRRNASRLVTRARSGEKIVILRRGRPEAQLQPVEEEVPLPDTPRNRQWQKEKASFERLLPRLRRKYKGKYVAVLDERVIDADADPAELGKRVAESTEGAPFFIGGVGVKAPIVEIPHLEITE